MLPIHGCKDEVERVIEAARAWRNRLMRGPMVLFTDDEKALIAALKALDKAAALDAMLVVEHISPIRLSKLEAVADAARVLARQWEKDDGGLPLGWLLSALADALDALDVEHTAGEQEWPDDEGRAWRRRCARLGVPYEEER